MKNIFVFVLVACAATQVLAVGENVGRITGVVREATGKDILPGATVTVTGKALIGAPRVAVTDDQGTYEVVNLPPGDYDVTVSLGGQNPMTRRVNVRVAQATPLDILWSAEMQGETVTILGEERHATRPDTSTTGQSFTMDKQNNLPVARQYQSIVTFAPGVTQNASGNPYVKGANSRNNRILIDGLDTSDPLTNTFSANINQDALAEVQVLTGGFEAKYNALGAIQNLVTNSGGDDLHFDVSFYTQQKNTQDFFLSGTNLYDGPRPFSGADAPPLSRYSTSVNFNGPVLRHKLWFSAGLEYDRTAAVTPAGPPLNQQAPNRVFANFYPRLKLTWAATEADKVTVEGLGDPTTIDYVSNNGAAANSVDPLASTAQNQGGYKLIAEWDHFFTPNIDGKLFTGFSYSYIKNGPQGFVNGGVAGYDFNRSGHANNDDGTQFFNGGQYQASGRYRTQVDGSLTARTRWFGSHEAEVGFQSAILQYQQTTQNTGGGKFYSDVGGGPLKGGLCDLDPALTPAGGPTGNGCDTLQITGDTQQRSHGYTLGFYAQDRYKPFRWWTILPGIRFDTSRAFVVDGGDASRISGFGPRISSIFDLTNDEKTIFQLSYGHATEMTYLSPLNQVDGARKSATTILTYDKTSKSFGSPTTTGGTGGIVVDTNQHVPPHSDEFLVSIRRELFANSVASIEYTYKRLSNIVEFVETNVIFDPSGSRVIGGRDGTKNSILMLTYPDANKNYYSGLDFVFEARPSPAIDFLGIYTLSYTYGPGYVNANDGRGVATPSQRFDQFANPRDAQFVNGFAPGVDTRHQIKTQFTYTFRGATLGTTVTWRSGVAQQKVYNGINGQVPPRFRAPNGIDPGVTNDVKQFAELRTPELFLVNLSATYDFSELIRQHVVAQVTIFNLFDNATPTAFQTTETAPPSRFGEARGRPAPFNVQFGLRYQY